MTKKIIHNLSGKNYFPLIFKWLFVISLSTVILGKLAEQLGKWVGQLLR